MLTCVRCGKSTTCVEKHGKSRVKAVSKWEKLHHFPAFCPRKEGKVRLPTRLFPPLTAFTRYDRRAAMAFALRFEEIVSRGSRGSRLTLPLCSLRSIAANLCSLRFMVSSVSVFNSCFIRGSTIVRLDFQGTRPPPVHGMRSILPWDVLLVLTTDANTVAHHPSKSSVELQPPELDP